MTRTNTTPYCTERRIFFAALSLLLILFGAYVYFVSASIVHVIARKEIDREIAQVNSRIGDLESAYIVAQQAITEDTISEYGFASVSASKVYIERAPTNLVLLTHNEI